MTHGICDVCGGPTYNRWCGTCDLADRILNLPDLREIYSDKKPAIVKAIEARKRNKIACYSGPPRFYRLEQHVTNFRYIGSPNIFPVVDEFMEEIDVETNKPKNSNNNGWIPDPGLMKMSSSGAGGG